MKVEAQGRMVAGQPQQEWVRMRITAAACISAQRPGAQCRACADICPVDAITIHDRQITLSGEQCAGCGQCAPVCPTGALLADSFPDLTSRAQPVLECARIPTSDRVPGASIVPCFGALSTTTLLAASAKGGITLVNRQQCRDCALGGGDAPWTQAANKAQDILAQIAIAPAIALRVIEMPMQANALLPIPNASKEAAPSLSRRALFARVIAPQRPVDPTIIDHQNAIPQPVDVSALDNRLSVLQELAAGSPVPATVFPVVTLDEKCCANALCGRVCPTGALQAEDNTTEQTLSFDPARCIACGDCVSICPTKAIALHPRGDGVYAGRIALRVSRRSICPVCDSNFAPDESGDDRCPSCRIDRGLAALGHMLMRRNKPPDLDA